MCLCVLFAGTDEEYVKYDHNIFSGQELFSVENKFDVLFFSLDFSSPSFSDLFEFVSHEFE